MPIETGIQLGPYEIVEPLGSGGMGEVYRARDSRLEREVAVKVLPQHLADNTDILVRFEREMKVLAALSHPNIVSIYDIGMDKGIRYAVMELLSGQTLRRKIERGIVDWKEALEIGIAIASGLIAAHSKGVIHRDLKPENVFLIEDGRLKILDFGLVHWTGFPDASVTEAPTQAMTKMGMLMGTVNYMSPEQVRGIAVDERSDIFSFGAVLYEMMNGRRPFGGNHPADTIASILKDPPADFVTPAPAELLDLIRRCLQKDPADRFQSVSELLDALQQISGEILVVPPKKKRGHPKKRPLNSVAILPFANESDDPEMEYLSDGLTDSIISTLSEHPKLRVMASNTVFRYKGKDLDARQVGQELNVRAVLTGRVVVHGESLSIQTELVDVDDGSRLWGERYNRALNDILNVQEEIACTISGKLRLKLVREVRRRINKRYTESTEAYKLYLKGRYHWAKRTEESFRTAIGFFEQAIEADPAFALAFDGLADCYSLLGGFGYMASQDAYPLAKAAAQKALEMDDELVEAHTTLAVAMERYDWDWGAAEEQYKIAIQLNPSYATAHQWYGGFLLMMGRFDESLEQLKTALELDPLALAIQCDIGYHNFVVHQCEKAVEEYRKALEMDPNFVRAHVDLGLVLAHMGKYEEAVAEIQTALDYSQQSPDFNSSLAYVYARSGQKEKARQILHNLWELSKSRYVSPFVMGVVHAGMGEFDEAFDYLEKAYSERQNALVSLKVNPRVDPLRSDPRFADLLKRVGLA